MTKRAGRRSLRRSLVAASAAMVLLAGMLVGLSASGFADDGPKPDPAGTATGDKTTAVDAAGNPFAVAEPTDKTAPDYAKNKKDFDDYQAQVAKEPLAVKLADSVGHVRVATNFAWTLNTGYLVLFMQAGFRAADVRAGAEEECRASDDAELRGLCFCLPRLLRGGICIPVWSGRHQRCADKPGRRANAESFPDWQRAMGLRRRQGFFPRRARPTMRAATVLTLFEVVFMETAGYIIVGAICERITFWAFLLCELFIGAILYPISGCWTWGGGWMSQLGSTMNLGHGYVDFAGSTVVHAVGGFCAMALAIILGPRLGKFGPGGKIRVFPAHNIVYVVTGTFILLFGWMGFNPGSTLGATDLRISVVAVNTNLAACRRLSDGHAHLVLPIWQARHHDGL